MTEKFQIVESKINKPLTYFLTGMIWLAVMMIVAVISVVFETIFNNFRQYLENSPGILLVLLIALPLLIVCCVALIMTLTCRKKEKIQKIIIDEKGITFYNHRKNIIKTLLYDELQPNPNHPGDVYVVNLISKYSKTTLNAFIKNKVNESVPTTIDFTIGLVILSNQNELYRHFLKGIQHFRPDLKIGQQTIEQYNLATELPPNSKFGVFEYFITAFFLLTSLGVIYALIVIIGSLF